MKPNLEFQDWKTERYKEIIKSGAVRLPLWPVIFVQNIINFVVFV